MVARLLAGLVVLLAATTGAVQLSAGPAAASCVEPSVDFLDTSDVALSGVVTDRRESGDDVITTVRVDRVFKGDVTRRVDVVSPGDEVTSAMTASPGDRLIVFGQMDAGEVTSNGCLSVTAPGEYYGEILDQLGEGTAPRAGYLQAERRTLGLNYEQFSAARAVFGALVLIAMGYFLVRGWRARRRTT